jgi:hypothetical protein
MRPAGAATNHPMTMATRPAAMHPRNQPQRMWKPGGRVSEGVASAGSVVTIPAFVRDSRTSNPGSHLLFHWPSKSAAGARPTAGFRNASWRRAGFLSSRSANDEAGDEVKGDLGDSCQPWSMVSEWLRLGISMISVTPRFLRCFL